MKPSTAGERLVNRRVIFKLHGMGPLDATVLKQDWPANSTNPIVRCRTAMCATLNSAASNGCGLRDSGPDGLLGDPID